MKIVWLTLTTVVMMAQHPGGDHMHRRFEEPEKWAKNFDDPARDKWQMPEKVIAALALKPGMSVADIGAGTGYFTVRLAKAGVAKVYAVDIEEPMVGYIRRRAEKEGLKNVMGVVAGAATANIPEPVDVIVIVDTFHHIPAREAYFKGLAGSLKKGGRLAIIDWLPGGPMGPPEAFRFSPEKIQAELATAGWKKTGQHTFLPNQSFTIYQR